MSKTTKEHHQSSDLATTNKQQYTILIVNIRVQHAPRAAAVRTVFDYHNPNAHAVQYTTFAFVPAKPLILIFPHHLNSVRLSYEDIRKLQ